MASAKFTRIPKTHELMRHGVPVEVIPTYCALADYANNKTGLCFPQMNTLAKTLGRSVRTIQRHLHTLRELGLIEFVERRRTRGRFSSYLYRVLHIARTTGHGKRVIDRPPNRRRTKRTITPPINPPKEAFNWLVGGHPAFCISMLNRRDPSVYIEGITTRLLCPRGYLITQCCQVV